ncbi:class I SAM-dependent methyltransferase [Mycolicibacterium sphagni]|uniref:SAM-dependent methyltransferase n=1 Tax=Mycolicibacterium sphagni TaxID=1786 RepID=A0A255DAB5_9MYCO|nr:class I SAM-dependent methyltransferase [Mycolicibacterium sphagni]MCV7174591.1 class I SAM-dependent methyltransferase [Mycolicibacterium sphagni]OYN76050.1 SAM-dependent methyltransferase [Mycolicibacterium sphagni]
MSQPSDAAALATEWDTRYASFADSIPDLAPNKVMIDEVGAMQPGRALDIGCGVGAEAIWLASRGWTVIALDVSAVALEHAAQRGRHAGVEVQWVPASLEHFAIPVGGFDLVTTFYPALRHSDTQTAQRALLTAVGGSGTLLAVHHADVDAEKAKSYGFDPADYLSHDDVVELLDDSWEVRMQRRLPRAIPAGPEGQHTHDDVVIARRR